MPDEAIISLHRYYLWSRQLYLLFASAFWQQKEFIKAQPETTLASTAGIIQCYWYASVYIVIEGYRELGMSDPEIDTLLQSPHVESLRRLRNATFHFQKTYHTEKFWDFMNGETPIWLDKLEKAFSRWFHEQFRLPADGPVGRSTES